MKKLLFSICVLSFSFGLAQIKEGSISYLMNIEGLPPEQAAMMGDMETKIFFKGDKSYSEMNSMMMSTKAVSDENGSLVLMDQMGNKNFIRTSKADIEKQAESTKDKAPKIEYTEESKNIAGYECKKAIVTLNTQKDGEFKTDVWYTDKIAYVSQKARKGGDLFHGLKGMAMEFSIPQGPMKVKMQAKEVSLEPVPDSKFVLSTEGFTEMKAEDFKRQQGGK